MKMPCRAVFLLVLSAASLWSQGKYKHPGVAAPLHKNSIAVNPIDVQKYVTCLTLHPEQRSLSGRVEVTLTPLQTISSFYLDFTGLTIDSLVQAGPLPDFQQTDDKVQINLSSALTTKDTLRFTLYYHGRPANDGFGGMFMTDRFIYTVGQGLNTTPPSMTRYWMPCHDEPQDKALWYVSVTAPKPWTVVSNDQWTATVNSDTAATFVKSATTQPMATYLMAITAGEFAAFSDQAISVTGDTVRLLYYSWPEHTSQARTDWANTGRILQFFESLFGPYPFASYGMVETPMRGAMEHQTMTSFSTALLTGDRQYENIVAHELAHQWWGDWVTPADWRDIWLNEGFASYAEALWEEHLHGQKALQAYMNEFQSLYLQEAGRRGHFGIYDPRYAWGATVYEKGAWVLHMLRFIMGDAAFFRALRLYGERHAYANVVTDDFIASVTAVQGEEMEWFFQQWIYQPGLPNLNVTWESRLTGKNAYEMTVTIEQRQENMPVFKFDLDIEIRTAHQVLRDTLSLTQKQQTFSFPLDEQPVQVSFDPDGWLLKRITVSGQALPADLTADRTGLSAGFPNPFLPDEHQTVKWQLLVSEQKKPIPLTLKIFDRIGREVAVIIEQKYIPGLYTLAWDGKTKEGDWSVSGLYFARLQGPGVDLVNKVVVLR
jgi:aminopeptidase N